MDTFYKGLKSWTFIFGIQAGRKYWFNWQPAIESRMSETEGEPIHYAAYIYIENCHWIIAAL